MPVFWTLQAYPCDILPPTKTTPLDPFPPAGNQVFKHVRQWGVILIETTAGTICWALFFLFSDKGLLLIWMSPGRPGRLAIRPQRFLPSLPLLCWDRGLCHHVCLFCGFLGIEFGSSCVHKHLTSWALSGPVCLCARAQVCVHVCARMYAWKSCFVSPLHYSLETASLIELGIRLAASKPG